MANTLLFTQDSMSCHCLSSATCLSPHLADDDTLNDALSSCIDTWADTFDSVASNGTLLMPDGAVLSGGGRGGGSRGSVEHTEPRTGPGMEAAPTHSHAVQDAGEVSSELPDVCSGQAEIRGSADATAAETMQGETPMDMLVDDAAQVQELAPMEDAAPAADVFDRAATAPPHVASAAGHTGTITGPASPSSGSLSGGSSSEVEVSNTTGLAEIAVQQDNGANVNELIAEEMDEEMDDKGDDTEDDNANKQNNDKRMKNVNDGDDANKKGGINTKENADKHETADGENTSDKNNAREDTEEEASEEANEGAIEEANEEIREEANEQVSEGADKEGDEGNDSTPATQSGLGRDAVATGHHPEASDRQGQSQGLASSNGCRDMEVCADHHTPVLPGLAECRRGTHGVLVAGPELTNQSVHQGNGLAREFRRTLIVAMLALYVVLDDKSINDRMLVEMFQSADLSDVLRCPSPGNQMNREREEELQRADIADRTARSTKRKFIPIVDLTSDDHEDIDVDKASGRKKPRVSPRRMANGVHIIRNKKLRYKTDQMNHPVSRYLED